MNLAHAHLLAHLPRLEQLPSRASVSPASFPAPPRSCAAIPMAATWNWSHGAHVMLLRSASCPMAGSWPLTRAQTTGPHDPLGMFLTCSSKFARVPGMAGPILLAIHQLQIPAFYQHVAMLQRSY